MRIKSGVLQQTQALHLQAKFYLNVLIVWASGGQKPQFWANFDISGAAVPTPLPIRAKFSVLEQTQGVHLQAKFHLNAFIVSAYGGQNPQFWANFDTLGASVPTPFYR